MAETETQEIVVDFGKICRLCLTEDGVLISLYASDTIMESRIKSIPEKILELMAIKVAKDDGFPPWICHNCLSQVDRCEEFFDMCRSSQFTLNESYLKALTEAGVDVSHLKTLLDGKMETLAEALEDKMEMLLPDGEFCIKEECGSETEEAIKEEKVKKEEERICSDCAKVFTNRDEYLVHRIGIHHDDLVTETKSENPWTCDACGAKFRSRSAVTAHIRCKHLDGDGATLSKLTFCKYCGSSFSSKHAARHLEIVHRLSKNLDAETRDAASAADSYDCKICYRPFVRQSSLRNHIEKFHGDSLETMAEAENCDIVWSCSECDSLFAEEVFLMEHYGNKHSKYPLEVDSLRVLKSKSLICGCGVITSNPFDAYIHDIFYHKAEDGNDERPAFECPACYDVYARVGELKRHLISFHGFVATNYDNECTFCCKEFPTNESLRMHLYTEHDIAFKRSEEEEDDEEEEEGEGEEEEEEDMSNDSYEGESHACELCGKAYKSSNHLRRHVMEYHKTMSPIKCPLCPKVFPRKMNLHNHYKRRHLKQAKKFVCSYCGLSLKGKVALRSHEDRLHRNIRNYKCTECPEAFTTRSILRKHAQRHLAERPMLQCQYCERKFSTISGIERHVKTHEGVKDFVCELPMCGKSFYTKSELKRHIKFHTKDFRHVCPVCDHKFMSPGELRKHSTKHTGERPFKCHLCSCAYARRDDKVKHLKRVHNLRVKRVYGKPLRKYSDESEAVDTIVIDEEPTRDDDDDDGFADIR